MTTASPTGTVPTLADGLEKIWLDEPVHGEPGQERAADRRAAGVGRRASTARASRSPCSTPGIDPTHPDLAGRVTAAQNFTGDPDAVDHHGHGTHVASTIAGSGAASGGKYKGVAPGPTSYIGKVLDNVGNGPESGGHRRHGVGRGPGRGRDQHEPGHRQAGSDGLDPVSQALNTLSASSGALFVIAAGNSGPAKATVGSPGAADAALTVGAVDKQDTLAGFSGRGPAARTPSRSSRRSPPRAWPSSPRAPPAPRSAHRSSDSYTSCQRNIDGHPARGRRRGAPGPEAPGLDR